MAWSRTRKSPTLSRSKAAAYEGVRPDIQRLVPRHARRILDLGCSSGHLGAALQSRQSTEVIGIELDHRYISEAQDHLHGVFEGVVHELLADEKLRLQLGHFDCIIAADVLEHLADPWETLRHAVQLLAPGGVVIVSVPNIRFWLTFWYLGVKGVWPLRDVGIYDRTHLRWFTQASARGLMDHAGLRVIDTRANYKLKYYATRLDRALGPLLKATPLRPFFAAQYIMLGVRA